MAISFPIPTQPNQRFSSGGKTWEWNGYAWNSVANASALGATGATGPSGESNFADYLKSVGMSTTVVDTTPRHVTFSSNNITTGSIFFANFTPIVNMSVTQLTVATAGTTATSISLFQMGLYSYNETTNTYTKIAETANDTSILNSPAGIFTRSFSPASTQSLVAGNVYAFAVISIFSGGSVAMTSTNVGSIASTLSPFMNRTLLNQTILPSSVTGSTITGIRILGRIS
jgi:hypothetical protein